jgi:SAM-dependent methyltransferase
MDNAHNDQILDQFTRQAVGFSQSPQIRNEAVLNRIVELAHAGSEDTVLDVACGPGLLACAFAGIAQHVTGIDITPRMLEQARQNQSAKNLTNLTWRQGDATALPFDDATFSIVATRFSFHHFVEPLAVLRQMRRVCKPGGMVVVNDSSPAPDKADAYNDMERLRDPSHTRSLSPEELAGLFKAAGLNEARVEPLPMAYELESLLARSFPVEGGADKIRHLFSASLADDRLGLAPFCKDGQILFTLPTTVVAAKNLAWE